MRRRGSHLYCTETVRHRLSEQLTIGTYFRDGGSWGNGTAEGRPGAVPQSTGFGTCVADLDGSCGLPARCKNISEPRSWFDFRAIELVCR